MHCHHCTVHQISVSALEEAMIINVTLERWHGSPVIRTVNRTYSRKPAAAFDDAAAGLTPRQAIFYRNLIRIAEAVRGGTIPVDFTLPSGEVLYLDRGCIKISELSGFIAPLTDDESGLVSTISIAWRV